MARRPSPAPERATQASLDRMTYEMFLDCAADYTETARQLGIQRGTVKNRVKREVIRRAMAEHDQKEGR